MIVVTYTGEFETENGPTRSHVLLVYTLSLKKLVTGVKRMDSTKAPP